MSGIDNKRIAKNSAFLYIRTMLLMLIALYTSRVVLNALGESDYGVYSVVGGVVILFSFINSALCGSTQRFLNVAMGSGISKNVRDVFKTSRQIHIGIAFLIIVLSETVGLWFLTHCLNIPESSKCAANWVYQFSIITMVFNVLSAPYNATIISHEKMSVFAYFSIIEGSLKLVVAIIISNLNDYRLILYAGLLCLVSMIIRLVYNVYCKRHFDECRSMGWKINVKLLKEMSAFSGWSLFGSLGHMASTQGMSFIINIFFGTILNAALSIANQVNSAAYQTISGFVQAVRPQVMKSYACGSINEMNNLVIRGSKIAILLTSLFVIPVCLETDFILHIWLNEVPEYTADFVKIMLLLSLINSPLLVVTAAQEATGKIRMYQLVTICSSLICLPVAWTLYKFGYNPVIGLMANLILGLISQIIRFIFVHNSTGLSLILFAHNVLLRCGICILLSFGVGYFVKSVSNIPSIIVMVAIAILFCISAFYIGLTVDERYSITQMIRNRIHL